MVRVSGVDDARVLEDLCGHLGVGFVVAGADERVVWTNERVCQDFGNGFEFGDSVHEALERLTLVAPGPTVKSSWVGLEEAHGAEFERRLSVKPDGSRAYYRYFRFPLGNDEGHVAHCLVESTSQRELEESLRENVGQLASIREIVDTLYESLHTQEVLYLILIAVTAGLGFGFNRAFYLEVTGSSLRGRMGIGPSSREEAGRIWSGIDHSKLSTLRDLYQNLTQGDGGSDSKTNEIAARMHIALGGEVDSPLLSAIHSREPSLVHTADCQDDAEREFFKNLSVALIAIVPLHIQGELAGVLIADNFVTQAPITTDDLSVLKTFARYAGIALERSHLYDELNANVAKLQDANTELRRQQSLLFEAEKLAALGQLAADLSHEIRNPLMMIGGHANSLLDGGEYSDDDRESLEIIVNEVRRLEAYLSETLDFARSESAALVPCDLRTVIEACVSPMRQEFEDRHIEIQLELGDDPLRCEIAPDRFHRALHNLFRNAIEAVDEDGIAGLRASTTSKSIRLEIYDSGPGIPEELHDQIFEPFFTTKPHGTGLGMALARADIRALGGEISLQADERFGSIFFIELPLEESPPFEANSPKATSSNATASNPSQRPG